MIQFAEVFPDREIVVSLMRQLPWTHFFQPIPLDQPLQATQRCGARRLGVCFQSEGLFHEDFPASCFVLPLGGRRGGATARRRRGRRLSRRCRRRGARRRNRWFHRSDRRIFWRNRRICRANRRHRQRRYFPRLWWRLQPRFLRLPRFLWRLWLWLLLALALWLRFELFGPVPFPKLLRSEGHN